MDSLGHLEWTPGLVAATQTATKFFESTDLKVIKEYEEGDVYDVADLYKYGDPGQATTGLPFWGDNTPDNAVARMLIDDFDGEATRSLLNSAVT